MCETRVRGRVVTGSGVHVDGLVVVASGVIRYVGSPADEPSRGHAGAEAEAHPAAGRDPADEVDAPEGGLVLPGLVDVHCHGGGGASFGEAGLRAHRVGAEEHLRHGTTSVVAGVVTDAPEAMLAAVRAGADAVEAGTVAAVYLEGPFLAPTCRGSQDVRHLRDPDLALAEALLEAGRGHVRVMTVAPELAGADELVGLLLRHGVVPAVGHTRADAGLVRRTLARSAAALGRPGLVTHLFNGMPPWHHRDPGPVAGALGAAAAGEAVVELVADGVHLAGDTVRTVLDLLGPDPVALVTDATAATGMSDGVYDLGSQRVRVRGGVARLDGVAKDGPEDPGGPGDRPLAGGTAHLLDVVRRTVAGGVDLATAVTAATTTPAGVLGLPPGGLEPGARADLVVVDAQLRPVRVMRGGRWVAPATMAR